MTLAERILELTTFWTLTLFTIRIVALHITTIYPHQQNERLDPWEAQPLKTTTNPNGGQQHE